MRVRRDGVLTRHRVLEAAAEVFAERGFRAATVAQICQRARTNTAAINYHFRDKESLYIAVWKQAAEQAGSLYPFDGGVSAQAPAAERLRGHIHSLLQCMTDEGQLGQFHRLHFMEMAQPTGLIDEVIRQFRAPHRELMLQVLRELFGTGAAAAQIERCLTSIIGQCQGVRLSLRWKCTTETPPLSAQQVADWADHITRFSLGGIRSLKAR